jgi:hypothetical protein
MVLTTALSRQLHSHPVVPNGTQGSLTEPNRPSQYGMFGADRLTASRHMPPGETGTTVAPGSQNHDPNGPLGSGKGPPETHSPGGRC